MPPEVDNEVVDQQNADPNAEPSTDESQVEEVVEPVLPDSFEEFYQNYNMSPEEPEAPDTEGDPSQEEVDPNAPITYDQLQQYIGQQQQQQQDPNLQRDAEIARHIYNDPELLEIIKNHQQQKSEPQRAQVEKYPAPPTPPAKPAGYSRAKALEDPSGIHGQYMDAQDQYLADHAEWQTQFAIAQATNQENFIGHQEEKEQKLAEEQKAAYQQQQQIEQQKQQIRDAHHTLVSTDRYQMNEEMATAFLSDLLKGNLENDLDLMVMAWHLKQRQGGQMPSNGVQTKQSLQDLQQKANQQYNNNVQPTNRQPVRSPAGSGSGGGLPANQDTNAESSTPDPMLAMGEYLLKEKRRQDRRLYG